MPSKEILRYDSVDTKILSAVDKITNPIASTLSPKGSNVIYEDNGGNHFVSNDGVTIAKNILVDDPVENAVVEIIKGASLKTNQEAGDGTSTTILLSSTLIKGGLKLVRDGWNRMDLKREFEKVTNTIIDKLKEQVIEIKDEKELLKIAKISANNDADIAKNVVKVVDIVGEHGQVIIEPGFTRKTEIVEDSGFVLQAGMFTPELTNVENAFVATYRDVPVLVTDKKLYYAQEAETILNTCLQNGYTEVVIVAQDFIGEALPVFITNHQKGSIKVLLVKDPHSKQRERLEDLAIYLGGDIVSDKSGSIVNKLTIENFLIAKRVFADGNKTVISRDKNEANPGLLMRIDALEKEKDKMGNKEDGDYKLIEKRLASLTNGMATVKVGGDTNLEVRERIFRYEDAINATRVANKYGYLPGGGLALLKAVDKIRCHPDVSRVIKSLGEANIRQIAENCGLHADSVVEHIRLNLADNPYYGYNAMTEQYADLLEEGVIDPYKVEEMAVLNAFSIANIIISSKYLILNKKEDEQSKS